MLSALGAVAVFLVAVWSAKPYAVGVFHDDGIYAILAKSLATGQGYRYLHLPGAPAAIHYPPGYPAFLSLLWRMAPSFPGNVRLFLLANAFFLASTAMSVERLARRRLGWTRSASWAAALVATLSYPLILLSSLVLSEPLFVALLFGALPFAEDVVQNRDAQRSPLAFIGLGALSACIILVRTHGAALLIALLAMLAYRRQWRGVMLVAMPAVVMVAPWEIWTHLQPALDAQLRGSYGSYGDWFVTGAQSNGAQLIMQTVALNVERVGGLFADRFAVTDWPTVRIATKMLCSVVVAVGTWRLSRRAPVAALFVCVYVAVLLVWPYTPWRFLYAVWPLVILAIGELIRASLSYDGAYRVIKPLALATAAVLAAGLLRQETIAYVRRTWQIPVAVAVGQVAPMIRWASRETGPNDVLAVEGEQLAYLFANRVAVPVTPFTASQYTVTPSVAETESMLKQLLTDRPISFVATVSALVTAAADSLVAHSDTSAVSLQRMGPLSDRGTGEGYRVVRRSR